MEGTESMATVDSANWVKETIRSWRHSICSDWCGAQELAIAIEQWRLDSAFPYHFGMPFSDRSTESVHNMGLWEVIPVFALGWQQVHFMAARPFLNPDLPAQTFEPSCR